MIVDLRLHGMILAVRDDMGVQVTGIMAGANISGMCKSTSRLTDNQMRL